MALRTLILQPGECATLPSSTVVQSIVLDGAISVTSDCVGLPAPSGYICYSFTWEDDTAGSMQDALITELIVGTNTYNVPSSYQNYTADPDLLPPFDELNIGDWIESDPALIGIVKFGCFASPSSSRVLKIKVPSGIDAPKLKVVNGAGGGFSHVSYMIGVVDSDCTDCTP